MKTPSNLLIKKKSASSEKTVGTLQRNIGHRSFVPVSLCETLEGNQIGERGRLSTPTVRRSPRDLVKARPRGTRERSRGGHSTVSLVQEVSCLLLGKEGWFLLGFFSSRSEAFRAGTEVTRPHW